MKTEAIRQFNKLANEKFSTDPRQRAWLEIDVNSVVSNTKKIKKFIGKDCELMAVVKADGYGHGSFTISQAALEGGATHLGVATLQEGLDLRSQGIFAPILILGNLTAINDLSICLSNNLMPTLSGIREALICQNLAKSCDKVFKIHLKVDTGMTRLGCDFNHSLELCSKILNLKNIDLSGVYSHLAMADSLLSDYQSTKDQKSKFDYLVKNLKNKSKSIHFHLANSAGTLRDKSFHYDMVRVGLALYGLNPLKDCTLDFCFNQSMSIKAKVSLIRNVGKEVGVGYGHTFKTKRESRLAVIGIGYADGVSRCLSGKIKALHNNIFIPQVGTIGMDQLVLDVTDSPQVKVGSTVILLGSSGEESIGIREWSDLANSIPWEIMCSFRDRLPRVVM